MIENQAEYAGALRDLEHMEHSLAELMRQPLQQPDFDRMSVRRMIARLHEELAQYETHINRPAPTSDDPTNHSVLAATI